MLSSTFPQSSSEATSILPRILEPRSQYRSCHIQLPGDEQRMAAIVFEGKYYSLIKVCKDLRQAATIGSRLIANGNDAVITKIAKGHAIWRFEPDAVTNAPTKRNVSIDQAEKSPTCKILNSPTQYQTCQIRVPDLEDPLEAIVFEGKYYGLFKAVDNRQQSLEIAARLGRRGDDTIITKTVQGESVWVLEPDARQAV